MGLAEKIAERLADELLDYPGTMAATAKVIQSVLDVEEARSFWCGECGSIWHEDPDEDGIHEVPESAEICHGKPSKCVRVE